MRLTLLQQPSVKVGAGIAAVAVVAANKDNLLQFRPKLHSTVIEAISGAAGEVAQIAALYPLDTIKVRCQAAGIGGLQAFADLQALHKGNLPALLSALYAGALPATLLSILVGSVHYCTFCTTHRVLSRVHAASRAGSTQQQAAAAAAEDEGPLQHVIVSHGTTGTHFVAIEEPVTDSEEQQQQQQQGLELYPQQQQEAASHGGAHAAGSSDAAAAVATSSEPESVQIARGSMLVNMGAAIITAALTALVESPLELYRHNSQAGHIPGNFLTAMVQAVRKSGPRSLYYGIIPYCFESWPYDISELIVMASFKDLRHHHPAVRQLSSTAFDLTSGAIAGAAAVLVSMPFDVIKTYIQTHGAVGPAAAAAASSSSANGLAGSAGQFWATGKALLARGGPGALFVGLGPRLAHQVPGAMICWFVINSCHRTLTEHCAQ